MTLDERLKAAAEAIHAKDPDHYDCPWDRLSNIQRQCYLVDARAAIAAFQQGAPEVEVPVFKDYILECAADIAIEDLEPMHRVRLKKGTYVLSEKVPAEAERKAEGEKGGGK